MTELPAGMILASGLKGVNTILQSLPPDKTVAMVTTTKLEADATSAVGFRVVTRTGFAAKLGQEWAFTAEAETDWKHKLSGEVALRWAR